MDYQLLKDEILNGPLSGELLGKNEDEISFILNDKRYTKSEFIDLSEIQTYLMTINKWWDIADAGVNVDHPAYYVCRRAKDYFESTRMAKIDMNLPIVQQMTQGLVLAGILTQGEIDSIVELGVRPASRADILGINITPDEVNRAIRS